MVYGIIKDECYLGNGLNAAFDGFQIILRPPGNGEYVALQPKTLKSLMLFADSLNRKYSNQHFYIPKAQPPIRLVTSNND